MFTGHHRGHSGNCQNHNLTLRMQPTLFCIKVLNIVVEYPITNMFIARFMKFKNKIVFYGKLQLRFCNGVHVFINVCNQFCRIFIIEL